MFKKGLIAICIAFVTFGFTASEREKVAAKHIHQLKNGVLLVRLHQHQAVLDKLKFHGKDLEYAQKKEEIDRSNKSIFESFSRIYNFSEIEFFYAESSKNVRLGELNGIFLNDSLVADPRIIVDPTLPRYILEVGDIVFPSISGHQNGLAILDNQFEPLEAPFPYYVKRSGGFFIKRTDTDLAILLNSQFESFYNKFPVN